MHFLFVWSTYILCFFDKNVTAVICILLKKYQRGKWKWHTKVFAKKKKTKTFDVDRIGKKLTQLKLSNRYNRNLIKSL